MPGSHRETRLGPSETALKMMIIHVENVLIGGVPGTFWCEKGVSGLSSGASGQSGAPYI